MIDGDCAPFDPDELTGSEEVVADGIDQDCDGLDLCWVDDDGDGTGVDEVVVGLIGCDGLGTAPANGDCDDTDPALVLDCTPDTGAVDTGEERTAPDLRPAWFCSSVGAGPTPSLGGAVVLWLLARRRRPRVQA